jgi:hypothetical protein
MAYLRGNNYIWADADDRFHIWVADGYDNWDEAIWSSDAEDSRRAGYEVASGVAIAKDALDEFVVMRFAEIVSEGRLSQIVERVLGPEAQGRNFGGDSLRRFASELTSRLSDLQPPVSERI